MFLGSIGECRNHQYYPLALTQFCLGLRIGEACGLTWSVLDLDRRIAKIEQTIVWDQFTWKPSLKRRPKNKQVRFFVIPEVLVEALKRLKETRDPFVDLVFHRDGQPLNRKSIANAYNYALTRVGITHVRGTHLLRKTSATQANEATGDFHAVSKLLGHSSIAVTARYVAHTNAQKSKVANALNDVLTEVLREQKATASEEEGDPVPYCPLNENAAKIIPMRSAR